MKTIFLKKILTTYLFIFSGIVLLGQDNSNKSATEGQSEEDIQCEIELSNMTEFMKIDLPEYAFEAWKKLFVHCPDVSKNIYISGAKIYQNKLEKATDPNRQKEIFDTLMLIYDRRIQYFNEEAYVLGRKGMDIVRYNEKEYEQAYDVFRRSAELAGVETDLNVITGFLQTGTVMMKSEKISPIPFLDDFLTCSEIIEEKKAAGENPAKLSRVSKMLNGIISSTKINDCDAIRNAMSERVNDPAVEGDFLKICLDLLTLSGCENSEFFSDVNEKLMEVSPDPDLAYQVAKYNLKNDNFDKAAEFLNKAIEHENDNEQKALYEYQLAVIELTKLNHPVEAKRLAMSAAGHKESWGEPYFVAASSILEGSKICNLEDFDKQAVYWLAVDYCIKAKKVDPSVTDQANELIAQYKSHFPSVEETFFRSMNEGDTYVIGCWINESTTVKVK